MKKISIIILIVLTALQLEAQNWKSYYHNIDAKYKLRIGSLSEVSTDTVLCIGENGEVGYTIVSGSDIFNVDSGIVMNTDNTIGLNYTINDSLAFSINEEGVFMEANRDSLSIIYGMIDLQDSAGLSFAALFNGTSNPLQITGIIANGVEDYISMVANESNITASKIQFNQLSSGGDVNLLIDSTMIRLEFNNLVLNGVPIYANDASADADINLPTKGVYQLTGNRTLFLKP